MVWPFSSSPSSSPTSPEPHQLPPKQPPQTSSQPAILTQEPSKPLSRDEIADRELQSFLSELENAQAPPAPSKKYTRTPRQFPPAHASPASSVPLPAPSKSGQVPDAEDDNAFSIQEHLLPTTMSCRASFDAAFYCNSFGGRFNDLYRYGTLRSCSETWSDFWFCMKTKSYSSPSKENAIRDRYREKEIRKYGGVQEDGTLVEGAGVNASAIGGAGYTGRGSEDVWKSRDVLVEKGSVFREKITGWDKGGDVGGEEWNRQEREKRRIDQQRYESEKS